MRYRNRLTILFLFIFLATSLFTLSLQQDPVLRMVCPRIQEGKDLDEVINILNQDLENRPWNHDVRLYLGITYYMKGDKEAASKLIKKIAEQVGAMKGSNRPLYARSEENIADELRLRQKMERGVLSQENFGLFYFTEGILLKLDNKHKDAEKIFKEAIKAGYDEAEARLQLVDMYINKKESKNAQKELKKLIKLNPDNEKTLFLQGHLQNQDKKINQAKSFFEKALSVKPDFLQAKKNIAILEYNMGNYPKCIEILQDIIKDHPSEKDAHINLGRAYYHNGETEKAQEEFKAVELEMDVEKYSPKTIPLLPLRLTKDITFILNC